MIRVVKIHRRPIKETIELIEKHIKEVQIRHVLHTLDGQKDDAEYDECVISWHLGRLEQIRKIYEEQNMDKSLCNYAIPTEKTTSKKKLTHVARCTSRSQDTASSKQTRRKKQL